MDGTILDNIIGATGDLTTDDGWRAASPRLEASMNCSPRRGRFVTWLRGK